MEIHPYLTLIQGQKQTLARRTVKPQESPKQADEVNQPRTSPPRDVVEVVSLENKRALQEEPPKDLSAAESVLMRVKDELGRMTRKDLAGVHRLEGLVHFYMS